LKKNATNVIRQKRSAHKDKPGHGANIGQAERSRSRYLSVSGGEVIESELDLVKFIGQLSDGVAGLSRLLIKFIFTLSQ